VPDEPHGGCTHTEGVVPVDGEPREDGDVGGWIDFSGDNPSKIFCQNETAPIIEIGTASISVGADLGMPSPLEGSFYLRKTAASRFAMKKILSFALGDARGRY
jgi:hypothetical protein